MPPQIAHKAQPPCDAAFRIRVPIAHAIDSLGLGGAQQVLKYLVKHGERAAFDYKVYAGATGVFHAEVEAAGAPVTIVRRRLPKFDPIWVARLARLLRRDKVQLLHTHLFGDSLHGTIAAQLAGRVPVIVTIHNSLADFSGIQRAGYKWMLPRAARVVACSESAGESFRALVGDGTITAIPNGLDPDAVPRVTDQAKQIARDRLGIPAEALLLGAVGRMVPQKGFSFLLSAFRSVIAKTDANVRLVLIGSGADETSLRRQAQEAGIADRVAFLGFRADVRELMVGFDVLVFSSLYEGLPMTLLEGMASRRCIVSTNAPGLAEALVDGDNALLAEPRDAESLAQAILRTVDQPELRRRLGEAAYRTFLARYTVERMVAAYERLYHEILDGRRP